MRTRSKSSYLLKAVAALALAAAVDQLFHRQWIGATLGGFALAWIAVVAVTLPAVRHRKGALIAALAATLFALILIDHPTLLAWTLFWTALSSAAILSRARFDDALRLAQRLLLHIGFGTIRLFDDLRRYLRVRIPGKRFGVARLLGTLALPVIGGTVFLALFASANPLIGNAINSIRIPSPTWAVPHLIFMGLALFAIWPSLRPHPRMTGMRLGEASLAMLEPALPPATIILSLISFNAVFALQNALDILFLWSDAPLPGTITMADYAHRGAYSLIATAILAGLFVLVAMRPGSPSSKSPLVRLLLTLWVLQNLLLVASSILRTLDYIGSYSLTVMRISAIAWMALVGVGLALICWRLLRGRSAAWLINANALAAALTLTAFCFVDPAAVAAQWNVRHAREAGGPGQPIDLCYLHDQGSAALLPLIELESSVKGVEMRERVRAVRAMVMRALETGQADWHGWTWRNARRLEAARAALGPNAPTPSPGHYGWNCDGTRYEPPAPLPESVSPAAIATDTMVPATPTPETRPAPRGY